MTSPSRLSAHTLLLVADLGGVFVFALQGAAVGVRSRLDLFGVLVVGFVTALGGGIIRDAILGATPVAALKDWRGGAVRDILVGRSPVVLHSDIYAVAALLGGTVLVTLYRLGVPRPIPSLAGAAVCFGLRMLAVQFDWQLPKY
ncbi:MAG: hypothetical protein DI536_02305 [Archangium gephyra]|uniref:Glycine transporter domain-containing protein n=1 Tax=Archangium gephyra TaxID=48 RepID=A0A2W5W6A9_9BACT|nr:MAG: hypothetical protein DI536_02305 [Archangium gephyra]